MLNRVPLFAPPWTILSMKFSRPEYWNGYPLPSPEDLPNPGIRPRFPRSPTLYADSLPAEPPGKPKNIGVGSLSLLQQIFLTQESNWGLLHCRQILYQPSYQGNMVTKREWKDSESHSAVSNSLRPHGLYSGLYSPHWTLQSMEFSRPEYWSG